VGRTAPPRAVLVKIPPRFRSAALALLKNHSARGGNSENEGSSAAAEEKDEKETLQEEKCADAEAAAQAFALNQDPVAISMRNVPPCPFIYDLFCLSPEPSAAYGLSAGSGNDTVSGTFVRVAVPGLPAEATNYPRGAPRPVGGYPPHVGVALARPPPALVAAAESALPGTTIMGRENDAGGGSTGLVLAVVHAASRVARSRAVATLVERHPEAPLGCVVTVERTVRPARSAASARSRATFSVGDEGPSDEEDQGGPAEQSASVTQARGIAVAQTPRTALAGGLRASAYVLQALPSGSVNGGGQATFVSAAQVVALEHLPPPPGAESAARATAPKEEPTGPVGCGPECSRVHSGEGNCLLCGSDWGNHGGHTCHSMPGQRGSWPLQPGDAGAASGPVRQLIVLEPFNGTTLGWPAGVAPPAATDLLAPVDRHFSECVICYDLKVILWTLQL
jgi:hypothetical protein